MTDASTYNITVRKGVFDGEACFQATVRELPDVAEYADTAEEAYELAVDTIETTQAMLSEQGHGVPAPYVPADDFSGRVTLRLPRSLHRALYHAAESEGVSLNQQIVNVLSYWSGYAARTSPLSDAADWHTPSSPGTCGRPRHLTLVSCENLDEPREA